MMRLNSDQLSQLSNNNVSSSLATTALPTIITPMYVTDGESFALPVTATSSSMKRSSAKMKYMKQKSKTRLIKINGEYVLATAAHHSKKHHKSKNNKVKKDSSEEIKSEEQGDYFDC